MRPPRQGKGLWPVLAFFLIATLVMTWPLPTDPGHLISDPFDPLLTTWTLHWDWKQTFHDPLHLYDADIFHPERLTLAFSENLVGAAVFGFPLFFAGASPITVYSVLFLLGMFLSGIGAWALAREMTGDGLAAVAAGILYEFVPFRFDHLAHIQIQWGGFLPLCLLFLWRYLRELKPRDLLLFSLFFAWNGLANVHYGLFAGLAVLLTVSLELTRTKRWTDSRLLGGLAAGLLAAGAVLTPFYLPYVEASRLYKFRRLMAEIQYFSAKWRSFVSAGGRNRLYGALTSPFRGPEGQLFFGLTAIALAVFALLSARRQHTAPEPQFVRRSLRWLDALILLLVALRVAVAVTGGFRWHGVLSIREPYRLSMLIFVAVVVRLAIAFPRFLPYRNLADFLRRSRWPPGVLWAAAMIALGILIVLGANLFFYRELYELLSFLLGAIRVPNRGIVLAHMGLGVLAAAGLAEILRRARPGLRPAIFVGICAAMLFEYRAAPLALYAQGTRPWASSGFLASRPPAGGLLELPMKDGDNAEYVYRTTEHGWPILNGYSGFFPPNFNALRDEVNRFQDFADLRPQLRRMDARVLLYHSARATASEWNALPALLSSGVREGSLAAVRTFDENGSPTILLELLDGPGAPRLFPRDALEENRILTFLDHPGPLPGPPGGYLDSPRNGETFPGRSVSGIGWAACPAGIERIVILLDGRDAGTGTYGILRNDVRKARPDVPCGDRCGYDIQLGDVPPGEHRLGVRLVGKNGKTRDLPEVRIRVAGAPTSGT